MLNELILKYMKHECIPRDMAVSIKLFYSVLSLFQKQVILYAISLSVLGNSQYIHLDSYEWLTFKLESRKILLLFYLILPLKSTRELNHFRPIKYVQRRALCVYRWISRVISHARWSADWNTYTRLLYLEKWKRGYQGYQRNLFHALVFRKSWIDSSWV